MLLDRAQEQVILYATVLLDGIDKEHCKRVDEAVFTLQIDTYCCAIAEQQRACCCPAAASASAATATASAAAAAAACLFFDRPIANCQSLRSRCHLVVCSRGRSRFGEQAVQPALDDDNTHV